MLSVGREINIAAKRYICHQCAREGGGSELSTGLVRISQSDLYLYAYRCPECGSNSVALKGKLLPFRSRVASASRDRVGLREDQATQPEVKAEKTHRS